MPELSVYGNSLNAAESHEGGFTIDRPGGLPGFLFLHFTTAVRLQSLAGRRAEPAGAAILYEPLFPQWYTGVEAEVTHDWVYLIGRDADATVRRHDIPLNTVFYLAESSFIVPLFRQIQSERLRGEAHWEQAVSLLLQQLLLLLARHGRPEKVGVTQSYREKWVAPLTDVRMGMLADLRRPWSVAELARAVCLSPPRFAVLYRQMFAVSPIEDLIRARLERARQLLLHSTLSVSQVAQQCGFESVFHFSRLFHRRVGCPPSRYHRMMQHASGGTCPSGEGGRLPGIQPSGLP